MITRVAPAAAAAVLAVSAGVPVDLSAQSWTPPSRPVAAGELGSRMDEYLTRVEAYGFAAAVLVAEDGEVVLRKGYGVADREAGRPVTPSTVFTVGSITKQFTGAAILRLEEQGRLRVTDSVGRFFADVPDDKAGMTLHHLLTHTAGFNQGFGGDYEVMPRDSIVRLALDAPLAGPPGDRYRYSNVGYSLLGAIVEIASGRPYETYLREELFEPAGMEETGYLLPDWSEDRLAAAYRGVERWGTTVERPWAPDGPWWNLRANGGILSTVDDLYLWHLALEGDAVLSAASREKLFAPHVPENEAGDSHYGYGWAVTPTPQGRLIWHNGGNGYFFADFRRYMDEGIVVIFLTNEAVNERVERAMLRLAFDGEVTMPPAPGPKVSDERLARLAGTYRLPSGTEFSVEGRDGRLEIAADDPEVAMAFVSLRDAGADDRPRLAGIDTLSAGIIEAMDEGEFGPFRAHFARVGGIDVEDEVAFWTRAFDFWGERLGALRRTRVLGTTEGRGPMGPSLQTWVLVRFDRGARVIQLIQGAEGPATGFYLHVLPPSQLPARHVLASADSDDEFVTFDFATERATTVRFEIDREGTTVGLAVPGEFFAERVR